MASTSNLPSLPAEILLLILGYSRELSLINVCRELRACLPPFTTLARSFAILAFSKISPIHASFHDRPWRQNLTFPGPVTESFLQQYHAVLGIGMNVSFPLSSKERAQLQHDVLCSGWWNISRFHAVHLFLFRHHLLSFRARLDEPDLLTGFDQIDKLDAYIRRFESHWASWTAPRNGVGPKDLPLILPWKSMPNYHLSIIISVPLMKPSPALQISWDGFARPQPGDELFTEEACEVTLSQHAFIFRQAWAGTECWNVLRINESEPEDLPSRLSFGGQQSSAILENMKADSKGRPYFLPPRPLLTSPLTAQKRGILVYLIQEAGGRCFITDIPSLNHDSTRADDEKILHHAILEAIPLGDLPFLKILLIMLQGQSPPHLSADQSFTGELISSAPGSRDRPMVQLYLEKASWSQDNMDEYVLKAMRCGNPEALSILLDIYAVYDKRMEDVERFEERMCELLWQSMEQKCDSHDRIRDVVVRKVKSLKAAVCNMFFTRDKWMVESEA
ncbi:hypothetical protein LTR84_012352 [Exophiala bonariae]|uniref:F-box domain-containing protein n=1 Tax=Exophiala bonariae TaxID=1690606 RepID=A0AAV9NG44_9EURO|nr:hypothetical protein LTR84_012352 [Exophiala bonariae]